MARDPYQRRLQALRKAGRKSRAKSWVLAYLLENPCVDCGETDPRVLEFDHRDPAEKLHNVSRMVADGHAIASITREIAKCDVRCSNCHRRRTHDQGHSGFRRGE